jgi:hypothetical protein
VAGVHPAWLDGGVRWRASLPSARRSSTLGCGTLILAAICPSLPLPSPFLLDLY